VSEADLILLREVEARRAFENRPIRLQMLAPFGAWLGQGALRVLRLRMDADGDVEMTVGYESYRPWTSESTVRR
jgi:hypothetical protein